MDKAMDDKPDIVTLLDRFQKRFPTEWREDRWYLTAIGALISSGIPSRVGDLYAYLIAQPAYSTPPQRQHLIRRMREAMIKCIILTGIPSVIAALSAVAELEREEDKDYSFSREGWQPDAANHARGLETLDFIYHNDHLKIMSRFDAHRDLPFISTEISYGLFLSPHSILSLLDSELLIMPAIMCQNLRGPTLWHLRGCVRAGISKEGVETVQEVVEMVAGWAGRSTEGWARVRDVKDEMWNM